MSQHLLMIEDDSRLAAMVGEYLEQNGFRVSRAADGHSGLAHLRSEGSGIDLVILDLMLPDIDGLEVCRSIRALAGSAGQTPVLMLTAKGDPMDRIIGLEMALMIIYQSLLSPVNYSRVFERFCDANQNPRLSPATKKSCTLVRLLLTEMPAPCLLLARFAT